MNKTPVQVTTGRAVQLTAAGMLGRKFDFMSGHTFLTQEWFYPGEPYEEKALAEKTHKRWSFGTNTGGNLPLFFDVEDVKEVVIFNDSETIKVFERAPFKVIIQDRKIGQQE